MTELITYETDVDIFKPWYEKYIFAQGKNSNYKEPSADILSLVFGIHCVAGYYIELDLLANGELIYFNGYEVNQFANSYLHVDDRYTPPETLTDAQVDKIMSIVGGKVELFPGWEVRISLGATIQRKLQSTDYGTQKITTFFQGKVLA